jgi:carotenoid cleavage dioxygenase-like enzyme
MTAVTAPYALGYDSLHEEITIDALPVEGTIPRWLSGTLLRNGPAQYEVGQSHITHWFDGFAMLHRFTMQDGAVSYANMFLHDAAYEQSLAQGRIAFRTFATDPCRAIFKGAITTSSPANVSIRQVAGEYVAMTETPLPIAFDPVTLKTLGVVHYEDNLPGYISSAHPHHDPQTGESLSYLVNFGRQSTLSVYAIPDNAHARRRIGGYDVSEPAYIHSFGLTERYVVMVEAPFRVDPRALMTGDKPFIMNFTWRPEEGTTFIVLRRDDGSVAGRFQSDAFFSFHHVNAFEHDGEIVVDLVAYPDTGVIERTFLDRLRNPAAPGDHDPTELRRYRLSLDHKTLREERIGAAGIELPTINYARCNMHDYRVAYGVLSAPASGQPAAVADHLVRVDVRTGETRTWSAPRCYPGEPIFAAAPDAHAEDDGVVLSVVLNAERGNSFLVVLDAKSFTEIGRAEVPHHIPFGLHGIYVATSASA